MSSEEIHSPSDADPDSDESIQKLLGPLQQDNGSVEYAHQFKAVKAFHQRLRSLESLFADVYSKVSTLEQEIAKQKEPNSAPPETPSTIWDKFS